MSNHVEIISPLQEHSFVESFYEISDESHFWFEWRVKAFLSQLNDAKIPLDAKWKVLDVGGGKGVLRKQIESLTTWEVDFTDLDYKALTMSEPGRGRTLYYDIMEEKDEFKEKYDAVILFDVLEHIAETKPFLKSLIAHLKPNGYLFVNVPALQTLYSPYDKVQGHVKRYGKQDLQNEIESSGLKVLDVRFWGLMLFPIAFMRKLYLSGIKDQSTENIYNIGFKPPGKFINNTLKKIMKVETALMKNPALGTSLVLLAKNKTEKDA